MGSKVSAQDRGDGDAIFRRLVEHAPGLVYLVEDRSRVVTRLIAGPVQRMLGYAPDDFVAGRVSLAGLCHPGDGQAVGRSVAEAVAAGRHFHLRYRLRHRDGHWVGVMETGAAVVEGGRVCGVEGFVCEAPDGADAQRQLHEMYERLSRHIDHTPLAVMEWDRRWRLTRWSAQAERIFGWSAEEVLGRTFEQWPFVHPDDLQRVSETARALTEGRASANTSSNRNLARDGSVRHCRWFNSVIRDEEGVIVSVLCFVDDVTERVRAEEEVRALNERLRKQVATRTAELGEATAAIAHEATEREHISRELVGQSRLMQLMLENTAEGVVVADRDGKFLVWNAAATRLIGLGARDVPVEQWADVYRCYHDDERGLYRSEDLPLVRAIRGESVDEEGLIIRREGERSGRLLSINARPMLDEAGEVIGGVIVFRDQTEQKRAEDALRMVQSAIEQVGDSVTITEASVDAPGPRILYVNPAFSRMTGYAKEEVIGRTPRMLQGPRSDRAVLQRLREALERGDGFQDQLVNYRKDGTCFDVQLHVAPVRDDQGRITHWVAIQRDVTELREQERLRHEHQAELAHVARLSTMGEMASGLAHELNQPLAAISNYLGGCLRRAEGGGLDPQNLVHALRNAEQQAQRAGQIIRRLRDFVKKGEPRRQPVDVNHAVNEAVGLLVHDARQAEVPVVLALAGALPLIMGDLIQIEQVVVNLVRNAIEATRGLGPGGTGRVRVESCFDEDRGQVVVRVIDQGVGVTLLDMDHIFDPFFTTKATGMGMGLNISQSIVEGHGGRLWASRNQEAGMTFHLELPVADG